MTIDEIKPLSNEAAIAVCRGYASISVVDVDQRAAQLLIIDLCDRLEALAKFKAYVHQRLDEAGIPADPESPHKAEGCRIGGRLDIALSSRFEKVSGAQP